MPKKNRASGPKIRGVQKSKKKVVFWHKKCEKFRIRHPKNFQPANAAEKSLCTKRHFSNGNHGKKTKPQKIPKFPKFCKVIFQKKKKNRIKKYIFFSSAPAAPRHHFFFRRLRRLFFFFSTGKQISLGKV